jgi:hypothetical protein
MKPTPLGLSFTISRAPCLPHSERRHVRCERVDADHPGTDCVDLYDDPAAVLRGFDLRVGVKSELVYRSYAKLAQRSI